MRVMHRLAPTVFFASALLTACGRDDQPLAGPENPNANQGIVAGTLEARASRPTLTLRNTTEFVVGYMVVDKDQMVVALYPPCGDSCPQLVQGAQAQLDYTRIAGYTASSREAVVMWWKYTRDRDGKLRPEGAVQTVNVRLD
jgi:hypothetical protein